MSTGALSQAVGIVAPYYNLIFVTIATVMFIKLFHMHSKSKKTKVYILPWKLVFTGMMIFVFETLNTIIRQIGLPALPRAWNPFYEMIIIFLFIYALLLQKEHFSTLKSKNKGSIKKK